MASTLHDLKPERALQVLLRRPEPPWPYPKREDVLALVDLIYNSFEKATALEKRINALRRHVEYDWSSLTPRQWDHVRTRCEKGLRELGDGTAGSAVVNVFRSFDALGLDQVAPLPKGKFAVKDIQPDARAESYNAAIMRETENLRLRYHNAGHPGPSWFLPNAQADRLKAERVHFLSHAAQDVLLEHIAYLANLESLPPVDKLPSVTQLLVNAELGARYLDFRRTIIGSPLPPAVKTNYLRQLDFPFVARLPLQLTDELVKDIREGTIYTSEELMVGAATRIYERHVDAIVDCLRRTSLETAVVHGWKEEYLSLLKEWKGQGWSPLEMDAEWETLRAAENELWAGGAHSIELTTFALSHPYPRISHRMARRIGTSKETWEAERATGLF
ncbi:putative 1-aminocyclopropane-1-carboxylate deaminase [Rhodotorula toruloides ATCC 204091]|uniref:BY PROTMAP: gi/342320296/gb/EGU12237.1/ putative 1-aminocyclopropane-1-carboxylate deaminase [Rhodotorula glutinis ATCC 204091] n=1 Tax=Rhodotorula toruloides TaxID=5286 RepID=A0A0K3CQA1_RHOTO|nr:putative 1-aminocyclopropane-1-carboxylate deaminase [Rhodotorula toruloides ATCC 204091]KAK4335942.1 putative 1-aminocyclopropane-1-carboxylate deaminase [Rhodotorula toruloides]